LKEREKRFIQKAENVRKMNLQSIFIAAMLALTGIFAYLIYLDAKVRSLEKNE